MGVKRGLTLQGRTWIEERGSNRRVENINNEELHNL
jgi:hypothetical protein